MKEMNEIIIIDISTSVGNEQDMDNIQKELFHNGYGWGDNCIKKTEKYFYPYIHYLILLGNNIYLMSRYSVTYLKEHNETHHYKSVNSHLRLLKIKKIISGYGR